MNGFSNLAYHLCASLLRLYPPQFQAQFGAEMRSVLQTAFEAASSGGNRKVFQFCLREITQLPASLLSEYRASFEQEELPMSLQSRFNSFFMPPESSTHPGSWLAAVLAGLPHLLMVPIYNLFAGLALACVNEYQMRDLPPGVPAHVPEISTFIITLSAYSLVVMAILAIPFILNGLWDFGRRKLSA